MKPEALPFVQGYEQLVLILFLSTFSLLSILELVFAFLEKEKQRKLIKPFLLLSLSLMLILLYPNFPFLYLGALCGMLGDICFIFKDDQRFVYLGLITFGLNHLFYVLCCFFFLQDRVSISLASIIIFAILFPILAVVAIFALKKVIKPKWPLAIFGGIYVSLIFLDFSTNILVLSHGFITFLFGVFGFSYSVFGAFCLFKTDKIICFLLVF